MPRQKLCLLSLATLSLTLSLNIGLLFTTTPLHAQTLPQTSAHVGFLNKITGRFHDKIMPIRHTISFETLFVRIEACYRSNPGEKNESVAFFHISDTLPNQSTEELFVGWMFASTPSLSSLEHSSYDIWLLSCPRQTSSSSANNSTTTP